LAHTLNILLAWKH